MMQDKAKVYVLHGLRIDDVTLEEAADSVVDLARGPQAALVVTPNSDHFLRWQRSAAFRSLYEGAALVLPDGFPLPLMARFEGHSGATRLTGSDLFMSAMDRAATEGVPVAIIGGKDGVAEAAAARLSLSRPGLRFFLLDSPSPAQLADDTYVRGLADRLAAEPDKIVALCLGSPKQEQLYHQLARFAELQGCFLGVGAAVDFAAGTVRRAPAAIQTLGLEWLFRLVQEPRRLWRRYLLDNTRILPYVVRSAAYGLALRARPKVPVRRAVLAIAALGYWNAPRQDPAPTTAERPKRVVLHVGPDVTTQGGMASVIAEYLTFGMSDFTMTSYATWAPGSKAGSVLRTAKLGLSMMRGKHSQQFLHVHVSESGSLVREGAVIVLARMLGIPTCVSLHGADFGDSVKRYPRLTKAVLSRASQLICLGPKQKELVAGIVPDVPTEVVFNPSGPAPAASLDAAGPFGPATRHFVFAGEVGTRKGFDLIAEIWPGIARNHPDLWLHVCGPAADVDISQPLPQTSYHGTVSRAEVQSLLRGAEALLLPSRREVLPMSVLESLRLGVPVVASHAGELDSVRASSAVYYCEPQASSLQDAIEDLLATAPAQQSARSRAAAIWSAAHTSNESIAARLELVYSQLQPRLDGGGFERTNDVDRLSHLHRSDASA